MGSICCGNTGQDRQNHLVNDDITKSKHQDKQIKKLLLLGPGSSGKTTFFKQLKIIHTQGFSSKDRKDYKAQIDNQIIEQMQKLISRGNELIEDNPDQYQHLELSVQSIDGAVQFIELLGRDNDITEQVSHHINVLWNDKGIRNRFAMRGKLCIPDSCSHFFDKVDTIAKPDYIPTDEDILLVRKRTTGIIEEHFTIKNTKFHIFDVGGQRNERKKWMHCFENVTAVIFVASLSCYDEHLLEDENVIVMDESLNLFQEICNSRWFEKTSFILFLNKSDLFREKIEHTPITDCFSKYNGNTNDFDSVYKFIKQEFESKNLTPKEKHIYTHCTCATDRSNVETVFNDVQHIVVQNSLHKGGLI